MLPSHPAWGAWIEILAGVINRQLTKCRTPHGVRGLKFTSYEGGVYEMESHPAWGAWIEIPTMT